MTIKRIAPLGLLAQIDKHITTPLGLESREHHLYPSGASCRDTKGELHGACARAIGYEYMDVPKTNPFKAETIYTFEMGNMIEAMYIEWFKQMGMFVSTQTRFYNDEFKISGKLDIILRETPGSDTLIGCEIKSSYSGYFTTAVITGRPGMPPKPKEENLFQVMLYLDAFPTLKYFTLLYLARDKFERTEYKIRLKTIDGDQYPEIKRADGSIYVDMEFSMSRVWDRYKEIMANLKRGILPPRDYRPTMTREEMVADFEAGKIGKAKLAKFDKGELLTADWRCAYCSFKNICRNMQPGPVESFKARYNSGEFEPLRDAVADVEVEE